MSNPLLDNIHESGIMDTISVSLPTMGRFYEDGIIDENCDPEDLEVRAIGIMAELTSRDPFLLASGKGIELLIPQVCPAILQPDRLTEVDLEAILIASRIATHGNIMVVDSTCTHLVEDEESEGEDAKKPCGEENKIEVDLYDVILRYSPIEFNTNYVVEFQKYGQKAYLRPIEYGQAMTILKDSLTSINESTRFNNTPINDFIQDESKLEEYAEHITKQAITTMGGIINSVFYVETKDGDKVFDRDQIKEWLLAISKDDVKEILNTASDLNAELQENTKIKYICSKCGTENTTTIELDIQRLFFFTPPNSKPKKTPKPTLKTKEKPKTLP